MEASYELGYRGRIRKCVRACTPMYSGLA